MTVFWIMIMLILKEAFVTVVLMLLSRRQSRNLPVPMPQVSPENSEQLWAAVKEFYLHIAAIWAGIINAFTWAMLGMVLCYGMKTGIIWH